MIYYVHERIIIISFILGKLLIVVFAPQIRSLVRDGPYNATILFEIPQTGQNPEFFEVSYYYASGSSVLDQV